MKLYYHQTDGGAEYYCLKNIDQTGRNFRPEIPSEEGDTSTWILRTDGGELEINIDRLKENNIKLNLRG